MVDFDLPKHHDTGKAMRFCFKYYDVKPSYEVMEGFPKLLKINNEWMFTILLSFGNYLLQMIVGLNNGNHKHITT